MILFLVSRQIGTNKELIRRLNLIDYNKKMSKNELINYFADNAGKLDKESSRVFLDQITNMGNESQSLLEISQSVYAKNNPPSFKYTTTYKDAITVQGGYKELYDLHGDSSKKMKYDAHIKQLDDIYENEYTEELFHRTANFDKNLFNFEWGDFPTVAKELEKEYTYLDDSKLNEIYGEELIERMMNPKPADAYDLNLQSQIKKANNELKKHQENTRISKKDPSALSKKEFDRAKSDYINITSDVVKGFVPGYSLVTSHNRLNEDTDKNYLVTDYNPDDEYKVVAEKSANVARTAFKLGATTVASAPITSKISSKTAEKAADGVIGGFVGEFLDNAMAEANMNLFDPLQDWVESLFKKWKK